MVIVPILRLILKFRILCTFIKKRSYIVLESPRSLRGTGVKVTQRNTPVLHLIRSQ